MTFTLTKPREQQPANVGTIRFTPEDDLHVMVVGWASGSPAARAVALELADANRRAAAVASCLPAGVDFTAALKSEERT